MKLYTDDLTVELRDPEEEFSERFDASAVVRQVELHGKHRFCQPEQRIPGRQTCRGEGLCGEFVWDEIAERAAPGEYFPKFGVGLLRQRPEGGAYDMWKHYEVLPVKIDVHMRENSAVFVQENPVCLGLAARITKEVRLYRNTLRLTTEIINTGSLPLNLQEYQHNFVAIDDIPAGPGYRLELPFDGTLERVRSAAHCLPNRNMPAPGTLDAEHGAMIWRSGMDGREYHKVTEKNFILPCPSYRWRLSHSDSTASISETVHFTPERLVLWGVEHCICTEVYARWRLQPGERASFARTWCFCDENTQQEGE